MRGVNIHRRPGECLHASVPDDRVARQFCHVDGKAHARTNEVKNLEAYFFVGAQRVKWSSRAAVGW